MSRKKNKKMTPILKLAALICTLGGLFILAEQYLRILKSIILSDDDFEFDDDI